MGDREGITGVGPPRGEDRCCIDRALRARIESWRARDPDPGTRDELDRLVATAEGGDRGALDELRDRFAGRLSFGTAGLRAEVGAGPRRMNRLVVQQTAAGLGRWLDARLRSGEPGRSRGPARVVVGWDARRLSDVFALDVARVVAAGGGHALLLPGPQPTPVLAHAVRLLGADAGVMCTASHNPPSDNGCKVYLDDGAQIIPPHDAELAARIAEVAGEDRPVPLAAPDDPRVARLGDEVVGAYADHVAGLGLAPETGHDLTIVYTPLHGVGGDLATTLLGRAGFTDVHVVGAQAAPDGGFPTTPHPDPAEPAALDAALDLARRTGAELVLANDPDADRLGVAVPTAAGCAGRWRILTGNEIGALLCEHILSRTGGPDRLVVTTFVSSPLLVAIARHHGVHHAEVLTGFKWIVRPGLAHPEWRYVFGCEEALGFSVDPDIRDKDGLAAAVAVAALAATLRAGGSDLLAGLERLSRRHGHHASRTWSVRMAGPGAGERTHAVVERWRVRPPSELAGRRVSAVRDLARGAGELPPTDAVALTCEDGARVVLRPSGTEAKVKVYLDVVEPVGPGPSGYEDACRVAAASVEELRRAVADDLDLHSDRARHG